MTRKRKLRPEELDLWQQVARSAKPLGNRELPFPEKRPILVPSPAAMPERPAPVSMFTIGQKAPSPNTTAMPRTVSERLSQDQVQMDAKAHGRMRRGKLLPEARMDLHGMTLDQAHPELVRFISQAHMRGLRLVLVITGKGKREDPYDPMPLRRGVLKQQVPTWLRMPPIGACVLQVSEAHIKHGGAGAYYVYLRRRR